MRKFVFASIVTFASFNLLAESEEIIVHPLDTDKDGLISMEEAKADSTLRAIFTELDINQDGFLSHLELEVRTEGETN